MYPKVILDLIEDFKKLPSIGEKSAERLVLHLVSKFDKEEIDKFINDLEGINNNIKYCKKCHMISDDDLCSICKNDNRDNDIIMVVGDFKDVVVMENMKTYNGVYHVLGGVIDFSRGITDKDLYIDDLLERVSKDTKEVILATDGTVEGEITAKYLANLLKEKVALVSRLAYGLPVGMDLKYADELTLAKAVNNRQKY